MQVAVAYLQILDEEKFVDVVAGKQNQEPVLVLVEFQDHCLLRDRRLGQLHVLAEVQVVDLFRDLVCLSRASALRSQHGKAETRNERQPVPPSSAGCSSKRWPSASPWR